MSDKMVRILGAAGLAGEDYFGAHGMHTVYRKLRAQRRRPAPEWMNNTASLREVIVRLVESRACSGGNYRPDYKQPHAERLRIAQEKIATHEAWLIASLRPLMDEELRHRTKWEITGCQQARKRSRELQVEIEGADTQLRTLNRSAAIFAAVLYLYHLVGYNSVDTGMILGLKPPHVRQIVYRAGRIAEDLGFESKTDLTRCSGDQEVAAA